MRVIALGLLAVLLAGCGGGGHPAVVKGGRSAEANVVDVYSDLPLQGPNAGHARAIRRGIKIALMQANDRAGHFQVVYTALDDATSASGGWDPSQTVAHARRIANDPRAIYEIGDFDSMANELSIPILNVAGIAQVSPSATYTGLTVGDGVPGEPGKYYPGPGHEDTFFRLLPNDEVEAGADLATMQSNGCQHAALVAEPSGVGLAEQMERQSSLYGIITGSPHLVPAVGPGARPALTLPHVGCVEIAGRLSEGGVAYTEAVHRALPHATIIAAHPMCNSGWTNAADGGVTPDIDVHLNCTSPMQPVSAFTSPAAEQFLGEYQRMYGRPDAFALYGYEAMELGLSAIAGLGAAGDDREAVVRALGDTQLQSSVIGPVSFDSVGDTMNRTYGLFGVAVDRDPSYRVSVTSLAPVSPPPSGTNGALPPGQRSDVGGLGGKR